MGSVPLALAWLLALAWCTHRWHTWVNNPTLPSLAVLQFPSLHASSASCSPWVEIVTSSEFLLLDYYNFTPSSNPHFLSETEEALYLDISTTFQLSIIVFNIDIHWCYFSFIISETVWWRRQRRRWRQLGRRQSWGDWRDRVEDIEEADLRRLKRLKKQSWGDWRGRVEMIREAELRSWSLLGEESLFFSHGCC